MGRVSTCQKNCKTIDLRGAQVNKILSHTYEIATDLMSYGRESKFYVWDVCTVAMSYAWDVKSSVWDKNIGQNIEAETDGRHFPDDIFKYIFLNENVLISITISLKFVPKGQINNIAALI